jgi:hypothetical protein
VPSPETLFGGLTGNRRPVEEDWGDGLVVGVEGGSDKEDGGDATGDVAELADLLWREGPVEDRLLVVGEPLLEDGVTAQ